MYAPKQSNPKLKKEKYGEKKELQKVLGSQNAVRGHYL
jgi:hypothetical protein